MSRKRRRCNKHHLTPKSRKGQPYYGDSYKNLLYIHIESHEAWHKLFQNRTLEEVIELLQRLARIKRRYQ